MSGDASKQNKLSPEEVEKKLPMAARTLIDKGTSKEKAIAQLKAVVAKENYVLSDEQAEAYYNAAVLGYPVEWRPRSLKEIANRAYDTPHPIPWAIKDILPQRAGLLCSGLPHATKSINWLSACIEAVVKHTVWGKFDASAVKRTLFIETEDPDWLVENRIVGLMKGLGLKPTDNLEKYGFFFASTGPFDLVKTEKELRALIDCVKPDFVVLSTLQGLVPGRDMGAQKDMSEVNAMVVRLMKRFPLVVLTHTPRDSSQKRALGTVTQDANYLSLMHFEKKVDKNGNVIVVVTGDSKLGSELSFDLKLITAQVTENGETRTDVRRVLHAEHVPSAREKIIAYVKENPKATAQDVACATGCSEQYARKVMKKLSNKSNGEYEDLTLPTPIEDSVA